MSRRVLRFDQFESLLAAAALHRMMAQGFSYPDAGITEGVRATALELTRDAARGRLPAALLVTLRTLLRAWRTASMDDLSGEYSRLFLGAGLVPLREGGYGGGSRFAGQPIDIADINGFYLAFGFDLTDQAPVPSDHIGAELEFVSLLLLKKALAVKRGAQREASMIDRAMRLFFDDHLGRWAVALDMALKEAKAAAPYATMAELLRKAVAAGCAYLHIRPQVGPLAAGRSPIRDQMVEDTLVCPLAGVEQARGL